MNDVTDPILYQIDLAVADDIPVIHVQRAIDLLSFLRKSDATMACLDRITHLRTSVPSDLFDPNITNVRNEISNCVALHCFLDGIAELKLIRRLNSLRLNEALYRLDPNEKRAKVSFKLLKSLMLGNNERTFQPIVQYEAVGKGLCSCLCLDCRRHPVW